MKNKLKAAAAVAMSIALALLIPKQAEAVEAYGYDPAQLEGGGSVMLDDRAIEEGGVIEMYVLVPEEYNSMPFAMDTCWYGMLYDDESWYPFGYSVSTLNFQHRRVALEEKYGLDKLGLQVWRYDFTCPPGLYNFSNCLDKGRCPSNGSWDYFVVLTQSLGLPFVEDGYHASAPGKDYPNAEADTIEENNISFPKGEKNSATIYALMVLSDNYFNDDYYEALVRFGRAVEEGSGRLSVAEGDGSSIEVEGEGKPEEEQVEEEQIVLPASEASPEEDGAQLEESKEEEEKPEILRTVGPLLAFAGVAAVVWLMSRKKDEEGEQK